MMMSEGLSVPGCGALAYQELTSALDSSPRWLEAGHPRNWLLGYFCNPGVLVPSCRVQGRVICAIEKNGFEKKLNALGRAQDA